MIMHYLLLPLYSTLLYATTTLAQVNMAVNDKPHPFLEKVQPFGYQSTSSQGNDFAASIVKSPRDGQGYFTTGTMSGMLLHTDNDANEHKFHVGMHCYVMQMKPYIDSWNWLKKFGAFRNKTPTPTTCTSVRTLPVKDGDTDTKIMVLGYTEGDVLFNPDDGDLKFSEISKDEASQNKINGFAMLLSVPHSEDEKEEVDPQMVKVMSGIMLHEEKVTYPISVASVGDNDMVVVSMVTDNIGVNLEAALKDATGQLGDFEPVFRYGQFYKVKVERLSYDPSTGLVSKLWSKLHEADDGLGAQVTSIIYDKLDDAVIVAGTTHGQGESFGYKKVMSVNSNIEYDLDGFFFTLDATTGKLHKSITKRVETVPGKDEIISGMCKKKNGDAIYIVGSTNAIIDDNFVPAHDMDLDSYKFNAFIRKINLDNMKPIWTRQIGPVNITNDLAKENQDVIGMGCSVDEEKSQVYISGTVAAGASVVPGQYAIGGQDIFIAGFQSTHGTPLEGFHTQQLGSVMDEYVAKDGGGLTTDQYGNAVLFGTTRGNFIQEKPPKLTQFQVPFADVYFMSFSAEDAEHVATIETATSYGGIMSTAKNNDMGTKNDEPVPPLEIAAFVLFASLTISIFILAFIFGKRRATSEIEYQMDQNVARCIDASEGSSGRDDTSPSAAATVPDNNQICDISSYYGEGFALGKENPAEGILMVNSTILPNKVSLPGESIENVTDSGTSNLPNTYDELMKSFTRIMSISSSSTGEHASRQDVNEQNDNVIV